MPGAVRLHSIGCFDALRPLAIDEAGDPDADIRTLFCGAPEPGADHARGRLHDGGGVDRGVGTGVVDELAGENSRIGGHDLQRREGKSTEERFHDGVCSRDELGLIKSTMKIESRAMPAKAPKMRFRGMWRSRRAPKATSPKPPKLMLTRFMIP